MMTAEDVRYTYENIQNGFTTKGEEFDEIQLLKIESAIREANLDGKRFVELSRYSVSFHNCKNIMVGDGSINQLRSLGYDIETIFERVYIKW